MTVSYRPTQDQDPQEPGSQHNAGAGTGGPSDGMDQQPGSTPRLSEPIRRKVVMKPPATPEGRHALWSTLIARAARHSTGTAWAEGWEGVAHHVLGDQAAAQKLHGAAETSFTKKCMTDAGAS